MVVIGGMRIFPGPRARCALLHPVPRIPISITPRTGCSTSASCSSPSSCSRQRGSSASANGCWRRSEDGNGRRRGDVGAPRRGAAAAGLPAAEGSSSTARCLASHTSSRASAASRPFRASTSPVADRTLARADRTERRRQDHRVQPAVRHVRAGRGQRSSLMGAADRRAYARSRSRAPASAARSRSPICFRRSASPKTSGLPCRRGIRAASIPSPRRCRSSDQRETDASHPLPRPRRHRTRRGRHRCPMAASGCSTWRVALATAPRILLLDEPLAGLAAAERERDRRHHQADLDRHAGAAGRARHRPGVPARRPRHGHE